MDDAVNGRHSGHGIFEDAVPFTEDEIGGNHHRFAFVALGQEGKEHLHLITIMLHIANVIQDDAGKLVQFGQFLGQPQIPLGG